MTDWKILLAVTLTALCMWRREAPHLRVLTVAVHLVAMIPYSIALSNTGRNTFEHVHRQEPTADTFSEGVFAEAKAADVFARTQLIGIYVVTICMGLLAIWPAVARNSGADRRKG